MSELRKLLNEAGTLLELSEYVEELEKKNENLESRIKELEEENAKLRDTIQYAQDFYCLW